MRPTKIVRALNAAGFGEVISERQLYRHRERAGAAICRGRKVDLLAYAAWLTARRTERSAANATEPVNPTEILRLLERQKYCCALTGRKLTPKTASLDHILPVSRNGVHEMGNIQILHKKVNRAKGTLTNTEFIQLCREVIAHVAGNPPTRTEVHT